MIKHILPLLLAALALTGCTPAGRSPLSHFKAELNDLRYDSALQGAFEDYTTAVSTSLKKEPGDLLTRKPTFGSISSNFGTRKLKMERRARNHNGIDFRAPIGTPILAAGPGEIIFSGWRGAYGQAVEIDHGDGLTTIYAHMNKRLVKVGQEVRAGTLIGQVGNTGRSTGPHLHFEMRVKQIPMDPSDFVKWLS